MPSTLSLRVCLMTAVWCGAQLTSPEGAAADTDVRSVDSVLIERVLSDWRARRKRSLTAQYELTRTLFIPKGSRDDYPGVVRPGPVPSADVRCHSQRHWMLDFVRGRIRKEARESIHVIPAAEFQPRHEIAIFDGGAVYEHYPRPTNAHWFNTRKRDMTIFDGEENLHSLRSVEDFPLFFAHGIVDAGVPLGRGLAGIEFARDDFSVRAMDAMPTQESWRSVTLRTRGLHPAAGRVYEYVIDLTRDSAISTAAVYQGDALMYRIDILHEAYGGEWSLPRQWRVAVLDSDQRLTDLTIVDVTRADINEPIDPTGFRADLEPDYLVQKNGDVYRVGADSRTLSRTEAVVDGDPERSLFLIGVAMGAVAIMLGIAGILGRRNLARKRIAVRR